MPVTKTVTFPTPVKKDMHEVEQIDIIILV